MSRKMEKKSHPKPEEVLISSFAKDVRLLVYGLTRSSRLLFLRERINICYYNKVKPFFIRKGFFSDKTFYLDMILRIAFVIVEKIDGAFLYLVEKGWF